MIQELHAGATNLAYQAMLELRPNIGPESVFVDHVDKVLRPEGYRLVGFFVEADVNAVAVAGFHLDSGVGPDRTDAHRLYFSKRMRISAFHFSRPV